MSGSGIPTSARKAVKHRSNNQCSRCGCPGTEIHHRQRRREAGHALSILVLLCWDCHKWAHSQRKQSEPDGYMVGVHIKDMTKLPIRTFGGWALFDNEGSFSYITEEEAHGHREL